MKICKECQFYEERPMTHPQTGAFGHIALCNNVNCRDVLDGSPIPALAARQQDVYCGFVARLFKKKEDNIEEAQVISMIKS